jgi:hypothetical protein
MQEEFVETAKLALVAPAATITVAGIDATPALLLESPTDTPPAAAADVRVTTPVDGLPPFTVVGLTASDESVTAGLTLSRAEVRTPL